MMDIPSMIAIGNTSLGIATETSISIHGNLDTAHPQVLLALLFMTFLHGILTVQVFLYYISFPTERVYLKCIVYSVYILESAQIIVVCHQMYILFVEMLFQAEAGKLSNFNPSGIPSMILDLRGHEKLEIETTVLSSGISTKGGNLCETGNPLDRIGISWIGTLTLGPIVTFLVQWLYAYRIYKFGTSSDVVSLTIGSSLPQVLGLVIVLISTVQCVAGIMYGVQVHMAGCFSQAISSRMKTTAGIWNGGGVLCDSIIAASMTYLLYKCGHMGFGVMQRFVQRLIRLTIGTGTWTVIIAAVNLISLNLPRNHATFYQTLLSTVSTGVLSKVYAISMLVLLNSRAELSCHYDETEEHVLEWHVTGRSA